MNKSLHKLLPVLFGFFVMGFCDVVGIWRREAFAMV